MGLSNELSVDRCRVYRIVGGRSNWARSGRSATADVLDPCVGPWTVALFRSTVVCIVALALIAACGGEGGDSVDGASSVDPQALDALRLELFGLRADYIEQCMRDEGFDYTVPEGERLETFRSRGPDDISVIGYGIAASRLERGEVAALRSEAISDQLGAQDDGIAFLETLYGGPDFVGCEVAGAQRVQVERPSDVAALLAASQPDRIDIDADIGERVAASPIAIQLDVDWASCMAGRGYRDLSNPADAPALVLRELAGLGDGGAGGEELRDVVDFEVGLALADRMCRDAIGYDDKIVELIEAEID